MNVASGTPSKSTRSSRDSKIELKLMERLELVGIGILHLKWHVGRSFQEVHSVITKCQTALGGLSGFVRKQEEFGCVMASIPNAVGWHCWYRVPIRDLVCIQKKTTIHRSQGIWLVKGTLLIVSVKSSNLQCFGSRPAMWELPNQNIRLQKQIESAHTWARNAGRIDRVPSQSLDRAKDSEHSSYRSC